MHLNVYGAETYVFLYNLHNERHVDTFCTALEKKIKTIIR